MKSLFKKKPIEPDIRAAFFALASLMMILLPTLLMVTNPEKMVSLPLSLSNGQSQFTASSTGGREERSETPAEVKCLRRYIPKFQLAFNSTKMPEDSSVLNWF